VEATPQAFPTLPKVRIQAMTQRYRYGVDAATGRWRLEALEVRTEVELKKLLDAQVVLESSIRFEGVAK